MLILTLVFALAACDGGNTPNTPNDPEHTHTYGEWETTKEASCLEAGTKVRRCACLEQENGTIPATGHSFGDWVIDRATTCITTGTRRHACAVCNTYVSEAYSDADAHNYATAWTNDVTVTATQDSRGYYLGSDGCYYAKVTASSYSSGYTFSSGASVTSGNVYYFKVEPIRWRILSENGDTALIRCDSIVANKRFDDSSNNYKDSEIRAWLNAEFYNTAFSSLQKELINTVLVDNSVYSTGYDSNPYACGNTNDKIFLLSYREVTNSAYGFASLHNKRHCPQNDGQRLRKSNGCDYVHFEQLLRQRLLVAALTRQLQRQQRAL